MILCIRKNNKVYLAYDEYSSFIVGITHKDKFKDDNKLIAKPVNTDETIITSDDMRFLDILRYEDIYDLEWTFESLQKDLVPKLKQLAFEYSLVEEYGMLPGTVYIAHKSLAYLVNVWGLLIRVDRYFSSERNTKIAKYIVDTYYDDPIESIIDKVFNTFSKYMGTKVKPVYSCSTSPNIIMKVDV